MGVKNVVKRKKKNIRGARVLLLIIIYTARNDFAGVLLHECVLKNIVLRIYFLKTTSPKIRISIS